MKCNPAWWKPLVTYCLIYTDSKGQRIVYGGWKLEYAAYNAGDRLVMLKGGTFEVLPVNPKDLLLEDLDKANA